MTALVIAILILLGIGITLVILLAWKRPRCWLRTNKDAVQAASSLIGVIAVGVAVFGAAITYYFAAQEQKDIAQQEQHDIQQENYAIKQDTKASQVQAETAATSALQEHLLLAVEHPDLATQQKPEVVKSRYREPPYPSGLSPQKYPRKAQLDPKYAWFASQAMYAAENTYLLMVQAQQANGQQTIGQVTSKRPAEWLKTVEGLIERHNTYVCHKVVFPSGQYPKSFLNVIDKVKHSEHICKKKKILHL